MLGWRLGAASGNCVITASGKFCLEDSRSPLREPFILSVVCTAVSIVPGRMAKSSELSKFSLNRTQIHPFIFAPGSVYPEREEGACASRWAASY